MMRATPRNQRGREVQVSGTFLGCDGQVGTPATRGSDNILGWSAIADLRGLDLRGAPNQGHSRNRFIQRIFPQILSISGGDSVLTGLTVRRPSYLFFVPTFLTRYEPRTGVVVGSKTSPAMKT